MIAIGTLDPAMADTVSDLQKREETFAFATVVRTVGSTAAKPGTKAVLSADGEIMSGWLGGGCTRAAVRKATLAAVAEGTPRLISVAPEEELRNSGVDAGHEVDGVHYARNGCPSKGTVDIFIEPSLPTPELVVFGASPVAKAVARLAPDLHWQVTELAAKADLPEPVKSRSVVVATQGQGDRDALIKALNGPAEYIGFVGSARKFKALASKLIADGVAAEDIERVSAPAGLDIGAITPDEIALSILAELTRVRRQKAHDHA